MVAIRRLPLRLALEDVDGADEPLLAAFASAHARLRLAEALLAGGGDRGAAREALSAALAAAEGLGAQPLAQRIEALAGRARPSLHPDRARPGATGSTADSEARRLGLSEREIEVLSLLAEGLSDRDIGARLFITTKTAGHHVSHILHKLGVARRGEAAAIAFRLGLAG